MRKALTLPPILTTFYSSTIESILTNCITMWCVGCSAFDWKDVRRVVRTAEQTTGISLPSNQDIARKCCSSQIESISTTPHTLTVDCFPHLPLAKGSAASGAGPPGSATALSPRPSDCLVANLSYRTL